MENDRDVAFLMKISFGLFFLLFYILIPVLLKSFLEWRILVLLLASFLFISYCVLRYYLLLRHLGNRTKAFQRQLLENGIVFLGLTLLYISEGYVYVHVTGNSMPSYRFPLVFLAHCCLGPTLHTNIMTNPMIRKTKTK